MEWKLPGWVRNHPAELRDEETAETLTVQSRVIPSRLGKPIAVLFFIGWSWFAYRNGWGPSGLLIGLGGLITYLYNWKDKVEVTMTVSHRGFETAGNFGGGYQPIRWVQWKDVTAICYEKGSGGDDEYSPEGLWAKGPELRTCLLPGLSIAQAQHLAERIYGKFPGVEMAVDTEWRGLFGGGLTSLNLGR